VERAATSSGAIGSEWGGFGDRKDLAQELGIELEGAGAELAEWSTGAASELEGAGASSGASGKELVGLPGGGRGGG
jgi:hypothetical protein